MSGSPSRTYRSPCLVRRVAAGLNGGIAPARRDRTGTAGIAPARRGRAIAVRDARGGGPRGRARDHRGYEHALAPLPRDRLLAGVRGRRRTAAADRARARVARESRARHGRSLAGRAPLGRDLRRDRPTATLAAHAGHGLRGAARHRCRHLRGEPPGPPRARRHRHRLRRRVAPWAPEPRHRAPLPAAGRRSGLGMASPALLGRRTCR